MMRLIVISDLHVGAGKLDDCDSELENALIDFLKDLSNDPSSIQLVIDGDFLDFAQSNPWQRDDLEAVTPAGTPLCFTEEQSLQKLREIIKAHTAIFDALSEFLRSTNHELVVLPGNHDVDFFWERVREHFTSVVTKGDGSAANKLHFCLEPFYRPNEYPEIWIEHGHQYDDCNKFFFQGQPKWSTENWPTLRDTKGVPRLIECVGTRFLINFLNALDSEYPFVDNVKPFSKFLKMFLASSVCPGFGPIKASVAYWGFLKFLGNTLEKSPKDLLGKSSDKFDPLDGFAKNIRGLKQSNSAKMQKALADAGFEFRGMSLDFYVKERSRIDALLEFINSKPGILDSFDRNNSVYLAKGDTRYLSLTGGFLKDETLELKNAAQKIISSGKATGVIMGHTHESVDPTGDLNYVNIGSWTRYYRDTAERTVHRSWSLLKNSSYEHFPFELAYAQVSTSGHGNLTREKFRP